MSSEGKTAVKRHNNYQVNLLYNFNTKKIIIITKKDFLNFQSKREFYNV